MLKKLIRMIVIVFSVGVVTLLVPRLVTALYAWPRTYTIEQIPERSVAIVFGAGLWRNGTATPVLIDRVTTAVNLYFSGKVEKLLMSGDNRFVDYNEPEAMRRTALQLGVPAGDIALDYAGRSTYDTCYRAKEIFEISDALLVTQNFHLSRSLFTCDKLGLNASGVSADRRTYARSSVISWEIRELPAALVAMWDVWVTHPEPVLGDKEPIFPDNIVSDLEHGAKHETQ